MTEIKFFEPSDYEEICSWRTGRELSSLELDLLPKFGLIAPGVGAAFLYKTDSRVASIGQLVSNPKADKKIRYTTMNLIVEMLFQKAKLDGYKVVSCATNLDKLKERFCKLGFELTDKNIDMFARRC